MTEQDVAARIDKAFPRMTASERKVARALLADYPVAGLLTLVELASKAGTSHPTVLRFIRKLDFDTYPAFQERLRQEVQISYRAPWQRTARGPRAPADLRTAGKTLPGAIAHNVDGFLQRAPGAEIGEAARRLATTRGQVVVLGGNMSAPLAAYLGCSLELVRDRVRVLEPGIEGLSRQLNALGPRDCVCAFHLPRYDEHLLVFCREAQQRGSALVLFTDERLSPLADIADHVIAAPISVPAMIDSYAVLFIQIELLLDAFIALDPEGFRRRNQHADALVERLRAAGTDR